MKKFFLIACCLFFGTLQAQDWHENFDEALKSAKQEGKPIVLVFSGSDWCAPCIRLKKNILDSEEFKAYAASHYVLYNADFPRKKNNQLSPEKTNAK